MTNPFLTPDEPKEPTPGAERPAEVDSTTVSKRLYEGPCEGGPLHTLVQESRFPKGFLLVGKQHNWCWLYDWTGYGFKVRDEEPMDLVSDPDAPRNRFRAAGESEFDVVAAP